MFDSWCEIQAKRQGKKYFRKLLEKTGGRELIRGDLIDRVRSHYDKLERIAEDVARLGFPRASVVLKERLPQSAKARSGEMGEILAIEVFEDQSTFRVPVRRLRYKDGREMALRGDDFIGVVIDKHEKLHYLKGESKSRKYMTPKVVDEARQQLLANNGRPTTFSLLFVADRLLDSADESEQVLGRRMRDELAVQQTHPSRITHGLFALSGNASHTAVLDDLKASDDVYRHLSISFRISDHKDFIEEMYAQAGQLGNG